MSSLSIAAPGAKPEGSAPAAHEEHIPRKGRLRDPSPEDIHRAEQHRSCPHNLRFFILAQVVELARQAADEALETEAESCECGSCDVTDHLHLATAVELNSHFAGSAIESSLMCPSDFDARKLSDMELGDRLESLARYVRGLRDGDYEDVVEADVEAEDPVVTGHAAR